MFFHTVSLHYLDVFYLQDFYITVWNETWVENIRKIQKQERREWDSGEITIYSLKINRWWKLFIWRSTLPELGITDYSGVKSNQANK